MASTSLLKNVQNFPEYLMFIFSLFAVLQTRYMLTLGCTDCKLCYSSPLARGMIQSPVSTQIHSFFTLTMSFFFLFKQAEGFTSNVQYYFIQLISFLPFKINKIAFKGFTVSDFLILGNFIWYLSK